MEVKHALLVTGVVAACLGLLIGGLIGHFATLRNVQNPTDSPSVQAEGRHGHNVAENRKFLFEETSAVEIEKNLEFLSSKPHLAGTVENNEIGDWIEAKWKEYGFGTFRETYNVLLSYPGDKDSRNKAQILNGNGSVSFTCQTEEKVLDPIQNLSRAVPPFNAYAKNGIVNSSTVYYVNYCRQSDFEDLAKSHPDVDLSGSIVICRYGLIFRGNKVALAERNGAIGVIIYNDPADYAPSRFSNATYEDTFPNSPYLPPSGAQRGSLFGLNGDPLTAGFPSKDYAIRGSAEELREEGGLPNVPVQPMGYEDAKEFMKLLSDIPNSPEVESGWVGEIKDITYKLGGQLQNGRQVKIINNNSEKRTDATNIFGVIKGSVDPDRYVLIGNHYDAWMFGATDALSGTVALQETSRVFGKLLATGWRPKRTIIFCAWDAEEYGITGSFEWLEDVGALMRERAVAYVNVDSAVSFTDAFVSSASPLMYDVIYETTKMISHPDDEYDTLYDAWSATSANKDDPESKPRIDDLGAGSDHTGFYHSNGITSTDVYYKQSSMSVWYPLYHTTYETFKDVKLFIDPDFTYHQLISRYMSELIRSLSDSVMVPFVTKDYAVRLQQVFASLKTEVWSDLEKKGLTGSLDYLEDAISEFMTISGDFDERVRSADLTDVSLVRRLNDQLFLLEKAFLYPLGVHNREHIRHVVFAPSSTNAYGSSAFPGIGDALYKVTGDDDTAGWNAVKTELTKAIYVVKTACKFLQDPENGSFW